MTTMLLSTGAHMGAANLSRVFRIAPAIEPIPKNAICGSRNLGQRGGHRDLVFRPFQAGVELHDRPGQQHADHRDRRQHHHGERHQPLLERRPPSGSRLRARTITGTTTALRTPWSSRSSRM